MMELYEFEKPDEMIKTVDGFIRYARWIEMEKKRIEVQPGRKCEIKIEEGKIALYVNRVAG